MNDEQGGWEPEAGHGGASPPSPAPTDHPFPQDGAVLRTDEGAPRRWGRRRWALLAVVGVLLVAAGLTGVALSSDESSPDDAAALHDADGDAADDETPLVEGWDPEIEPLAEFVQEERGLDFKKAVPVVFLSDADFRKKVTADQTELSAEDREEFRQTAGVFRALGLLDGDVDLFDASNDLSGAGVIGYYSPKDMRIRVRGEDITTKVKTTLVHELTHALQDQYYDLRSHEREFKKTDDSAAASAFDALVEGDASRIETAYSQGLSSGEQSELADQQAADAKRYEEDAGDVPPVLATMFAAPYALGEAMLALAVLVDGEDAVDDLFENPPTTEAQLLDPWTLLRDRTDPERVPKPKLTLRDEEFDSGDFGALSWYLVLVEHIPALQALDAVDGWAGDSYVGFERDGVSCMSAAFRGQTDTDQIEMLRALRDWEDDVPGNNASIRDQGRDVLLDSCDPGTSSESGAAGVRGALELPLTRTYLAITALHGSGDEEMARCFGDELVHKLTIEEITDPDLAADPELQERVQRIVEECR